MVKNNMKQELNKAGVTPDSKLLNIDFDLHTDGDAEFKIELIDLMINNVRELQWSLRINTEVFRKVCHKVKSTVIILNCEVLNGLIDELKSEDMENRWSKTNSLSVLCEDIVSQLEKEKKENQ